MILRHKHELPPIPIRDFDHSVWEHDTEDEGMIIGYGATKEAALEDFKQWWESRNDMDFPTEWEWKEC